MDLLERKFRLLESAIVNYFSPNVVNGTTEMTFEGTTGTILGIFASTMLFVMSLSHAPNIWRICKKQSTGESEGYPYVAGTENCIIWVFYAAPLHRPPYEFRIFCLFYSSFVGVVFFAVYTLLFWNFTSKPNRMRMRYISSISFFSMPMYFVLRKNWLKIVKDERVVTSMVRSNLMGPLGVLSGILMYGTPLLVTRRVFKTKRVQYLPFWSTLTYFLNALTWFIYGYLPATFDLYIVVTNGIGAFFGFAQLVAYCMFYMKPSKSRIQSSSKKNKKRKSTVKVE